jgi:hypothetical protein
VIASINETTTSIVKIKDSARESLSPRASNSNAPAPASHRLAPLVLKANKRALACKAKLQSMRKEIAAAEAYLDGPPGGQDGKKKKKPPVDVATVKTIRIRSNVTAALTRKFVETMTKYQAAQASYKTQVESDAIRQVQIVSPDSTDTEIKALLSSGKSDPQSLARQAVLASGTSGATTNARIKNALSATKSKYDDVLVLEASILELSNM